MSAFVPKSSNVLSASTFCSRGLFLEKTQQNSLGALTRGPVVVRLGASRQKQVLTLFCAGLLCVGAVLACGVWGATVLQAHMWAVQAQQQILSEKAKTEVARQALIRARIANTIRLEAVTTQFKIARIEAQAQFQ